jgi:hypothetical protein
MGFIVSSRQVGGWSMSSFEWTIFALLIYVPLIFLWFFTLFDLFGRRDLRGPVRAFWALVVLFLPLIGILAYLFRRPRDAGLWISGEGVYGAQISPAGASSPLTADGRRQRQNGAKPAPQSRSAARR